MWTADFADIQGIRWRMNNKEGAFASRNGKALASWAGFEVKSGSKPPPIGFDSRGRLTQILDINWVNRKAVSHEAPMVELADTLDSDSSVRKGMQVQVLLGAPSQSGHRYSVFLQHWCCIVFPLCS